MLLLIMVSGGCQIPYYELPTETPTSSSIRPHDPPSIGGAWDKSPTEWSDIRCIDDVKVKRVFGGYADSVRAPGSKWDVLLTPGEHSVLVRACWKWEGFWGYIDYYSRGHCGQALFRIDVAPDTNYVVRTEVSGDKKEGVFSGMSADVWIEADQKEGDDPVRVSEIAVVDRFTYQSVFHLCECETFCQNASDGSKHTVDR